MYFLALPGASLSPRGLVSELPTQNMNTIIMSEGTTQVLGTGLYSPFLTALSNTERPLTSSATEEVPSQRAPEAFEHPSDVAEGEHAVDHWYETRSTQAPHSSTFFRGIFSTADSSEDSRGVKAGRKRVWVPDLTEDGDVEANPGPGCERCGQDTESVCVNEGARFHYCQACFTDFPPNTSGRNGASPLLIVNDNEEERPQAASSSSASPRDNDAKRGKNESKDGPPLRPYIEGKGGVCLNCKRKHGFRRDGTMWPTCMPERRKDGSKGSGTRSLHGALATMTSIGQEVDAKMGEIAVAAQEAGAALDDARQALEHNAASLIIQQHVAAAKEREQQLEPVDFREVSDQIRGLEGQIHIRATSNEAKSMLNSVGVGMLAKYINWRDLNWGSILSGAAIGAGATAAAVTYDAIAGWWSRSSHVAKGTAVVDFVNFVFGVTVKVGEQGWTVLQRVRDLRLVIAACVLAAKIIHHFGSKVSSVAAAKSADLTVGVLSMIPILTASYSPVKRFILSLLSILLSTLILWKRMRQVVRVAKDDPAVQYCIEYNLEVGNVVDSDIDNRTEVDRIGQLAAQQLPGIMRVRVRAIRDRARTGDVEFCGPIRENLVMLESGEEAVEKVFRIPDVSGAFLSVRRLFDSSFHVSLANAVRLSGLSTSENVPTVQKATYTYLWPAMAVLASGVRGFHDASTEPLSE